VITWWCTALGRPWSWEWIPYPGIWVATLVPLVLYVRALRRYGDVVDKKKLAQFLAGMLTFWASTDWPLGTLGAGYLASAHMAQFLLYTLVAAPLLMLGTPEWMARRVVERLHLRRAVVRLGNSLVVSGLLYNTILLLTHAPATVDALRSNQFGSFAMDVTWMLAGVVLWLPVIAPLPEARARSAWGKIGYLFVTTSVVAVIPASFLTFTSIPLYRTYELAPRIGSITAIEDQQLAGIVMKIGTTPIVWSTLAVMWFRWSAKEAQTA
jgi:putative membrane protein